MTQTMKVVHFSEEKEFQLRPIIISNCWLLLGAKPWGGLWASPISCQDSWEQFCQGNTYFNIGSLTRVEMEVDTTNFLTIDSAADLNKLPLRELSREKLSTTLAITMPLIDFEKMVADGIDGVYLTDRGYQQSRLTFFKGGLYTFPMSLYGWDCECLLIMNEGCIKSYQVITPEMGAREQERGAGHQGRETQRLPGRVSTMPRCVICLKVYSGGREMTCSDECHQELARRLVAEFGEFKKVVRKTTGVAYKVPTRDIIEHGIKEPELDRYPLWED